MSELSQATSGGAPATAGQRPAPLAPDVSLDPSVAALCAPISSTDPCGPDLDQAGDAEYLNFFAQVEGVLPASFFSVEDGKPFDQSAVDINGQLALVDQLLGRSRDIRLLVARARLLILSRDLAGFAATVAATAEWLDKFWEAIHPRSQNDNFDARSAAISALNIPTVVFALQYTQLFEARPVGSVTYRAWMIATGETKPRPGDAEVAAVAITEAIDNVTPAVLTAVRKNLALLKTSIDVIRRTFAAHQSSTDLDNLAALLGKIIALIDPHAAASATDTASQADESNAQRAREDGGFAKSADPPPTSIAEAAQALAAIADYYSRSEPSSPILPLVRQAHQLIGKSFLEVITILMPSQVEKAAFQIGTEQVFDLPVGKLSELSGVSAAPSTDASSDSSPSAQATNSAQPRYSIRSRTQALALLELVQRYFRHAEPSSPIPMLCERARALAQRDFMGVLRDVLPKSALKALDTDKA